MPANNRRLRAAKRRHRRLARARHDLTDAQWVALKEAWGGCAYCGTDPSRLQRDCVLPIARGGRYTLANVVPACGACNSSKCQAEVTGWLRRKRLDEGAFLLRQREITLRLSGPPNGAAAATGKLVMPRLG